MLNNRKTSRTIKNYGHDDQKKKLIGGVVITGGGSQLKHLKQLVEYITGMDTRIGYPSEHLAGDTGNAETSPILATAVGLLMNALDHQKEIISQDEEEGKVFEGEIDNHENNKSEETCPIVDRRKTILERWVEKFKEFLDNA